MQGIETDPARLKQDTNKLETLRKTIRTKELTIIEIKLALKWEVNRMVSIINNYGRCVVHLSFFRLFTWPF